MTKQEFVDEVARRANLGKREAGDAVDAMLETITDTLKKRDQINFTGFGKFATRAASCLPRSLPAISQCRRRARKMRIRVAQ